jgi:hypothetical protein
MTRINQPANIHVWRPTADFSNACTAGSWGDKVWPHRHLEDWLHPPPPPGTKVWPQKAQRLSQQQPLAQSLKQLKLHQQTADFRTAYTAGWCHLRQKSAAPQLPHRCVNNLPWNVLTGTLRTACTPRDKSVVPKMQNVCRNNRPWHNPTANSRFLTLHTLQYTCSSSSSSSGSSSSSRTVHCSTPDVHNPRQAHVLLTQSPTWQILLIYFTVCPKMVGLHIYPEGCDHCPPSRACTCAPTAHSLVQDLAHTSCTATNSSMKVLLTAAGRTQQAPPTVTPPQYIMPCAHGHTA